MKSAEMADNLINLNNASADPQSQCLQINDTDTMFLFLRYLCHKISRLLV